MSLLTTVVGLLLLFLGIAAYVLTDRTSVTALIPCVFGIAYLILGVLALRKPGIRKHLMHGAAALSLLGIAGNVPAIAALSDMLSGAEVARPAAVVARSLMALICAVHLIASVRSFLAARLRPAQ